MSEKLNIGLLVDNLDTDLTYEICKGARIGAQFADANLYLVPGRYVKPNFGDKNSIANNYQYNALFDISTKVEFDAIVVLLGFIASTQSAESKKAFVEGMGNMPVVTVCSKVPGFPSVVPDNKGGLKDAINHLIKEHGKKKLAMVAGPETNQDSIERVEAFKETLLENGLEFSDKQVVYGDFSSHCTDAVARVLRENEGVDALVFANDQMAIAGYQVLKSEGLTIGHDVAVVGFDDDVCARSMDPSLTTVNSNGRELGYKAVLLAKDVIDLPIPRDDKAESEAVIRRSCGCGYVTGESLMNKFGDSDATSTLGAYGGFLFGKGEAAKVDTNNIRFYDKFDECVNMVHQLADEIVSNGTCDVNVREKLFENIASLFGIVEFDMGTEERMLDIFHTIRYHYEVKNDSGKYANSMMIADLFFNIYKSISEQGLKCMLEAEQRDEETEKLVASFSIAKIEAEATDEDKYKKLFDYVRTVGMKNAMLYVYDKPAEHIEGKEWKIPQSVYLKIHESRTGATVYDENPRVLPIERVLKSDRNHFTDGASRLFMPLFYGNLQYGFIVFEFSDDKFPYYMKINTNLNMALNSIMGGNELAGANLEAVKKMIEDVKAAKKVYSKEEFYRVLYSIVGMGNVGSADGCIAMIRATDRDLVKQSLSEEDYIKFKTVLGNKLVETFGDDALVAYAELGRFLLVSLKDKEHFERLSYPKFEKLKFELFEEMEFMDKLGLHIAYVQTPIDQNIDLSEYVERCEVAINTKIQFENQISGAFSLDYNGV